MRYVVYPLVVGGAAVTVIISLAMGAAPWLVAPPVLLVAGLVVYELERLRPYHATWQSTHGDLRADITHNVAAIILNVTSAQLYLLLAPHIRLLDVWPREAPFAAQVLLAALIIDLGLYAVHRLSHVSPFFWRWHAIHHSAERLYWLNGQRRHPVHFVMEGLPGFLIVAALGAPLAPVAAFLVIFDVHLMLQHTNIDYRAGVLRFVFAVAENHRWHHRKAWQDGQVNYGGLFAVWDLVFGSFHRGPGHVAPDAVGIAEEPDFPRDYAGQLVRPFR